MDGLQVITLTSVELDVQRWPFAVDEVIRSLVIHDATTPHRNPVTSVRPAGLLGNPELVGRVVIGAEVEVGRIITVGEENVISRLGWHEPPNQLVAVV